MTAQNVRILSDDVIPGTGVWKLGTETQSRNWTAIPSNPLRNAAIALLFAVSPVTYGIDPWFVERKRQPPVSRISAIAKRRITIMEARNIALQILVRAEADRLRIAEEESQRGVDWEQLD